jgi:hypothetical protein
MLRNDDRLWWMQTAVDLDVAGKLHASIDIIFDHVDDLHRQGEFYLVNEILKNIDVENTSMNVLISYLTITLCAKHKLEFRSEFFASVERSFNNKGINEKGLLDGLD